MSSFWLSPNINLIRYIVQSGLQRSRTAQRLCHFSVAEQHVELAFLTSALGRGTVRSLYPLRGWVGQTASADFVAKVGFRPVAYKAVVGGSSKSVISSAVLADLS